MQFQNIGKVEVLLSDAEDRWIPRGKEECTWKR
jgi:hypothetical protein